MGEGEGDSPGDDGAEGEAEGDARDGIGAAGEGAGDSWGNSGDGLATTAGTGLRPLTPWPDQCKHIGVHIYLNTKSGCAVQ